MRMRVNRSLIDQQPILSPNLNETILNPTTAIHGRERGSRDIAGDITINEISIASSESCSNNTARRPNNSPRRRAPNDGRSGCARNYNVIFSSSLPPSTGTGRSINIDRMEYGYRSIAESINSLAYQQRIRNSIDINKDILHHVQIKAQLKSTGADNVIQATVTQTIDDLQLERLLSGEYEFYARVRVGVMMADQQTSSSSTSRTSDFNLSDDVDTDNTNA